MQIFSQLHTLLSPDLPHPRVLTAGVFDGMHRAHQTLVQRVTNEAHAESGTALALTFSNHPLTHLAPAYQPKQLLTLDRKIEVLQNLGVDILVMPEFSAELSHITPQVFVEDILIGCYGIDRLVVGFDFRFGAGANGDITLLKELGAKHGFEVKMLSAVQHGEWTISSTRIRELIEEGQVRLAAEMLGRPYELEGPVIHGYGRGATLGYPTANVQFDLHFAIPASGVYAVFVEVEGRRYGAMMNLGVSPTFEGSMYRPEAFLFDYPGEDLYGKTARVYFMERLREERKFPNAEALIERIKVDERLARVILEQSKF
ncbi:TPA: hypothetical protein DDW35_06640 [Candidatus Sumerlaeota bacterium]|jgi:riboflavin kinase / FMN adenylyltransferase|nr:hypothetical protein [Candidatus Sumerlaeota bacterium]